MRYTTSIMARLLSTPRDPWWHALGLAFGLLFAILLTAARLYPGYLDGIDALAERLIQPYQTFRPVELFLAFTVLGSGIGASVVALGMAFFLRRNRMAVLQLFLVLLFASISMGIAKAFVERARPEAVLWVDPLNSYSFPSGHATLSTALYGFLFVALYRRTESTAVRVLAGILCAGIVALVCASRLVLNVHYATDVIGGVLLGLFWLAVVHMLPAGALSKKRSA